MILCGARDKPQATWGSPCGESSHQLPVSALSSRAHVRPILTVVSSAIHFAASLGGCIGCCITCGRRNAAKTAKKAAASGCACAHGTATAPSDTSATAPPPPYEAHHEEGAKGTDNADRVLHIDEPAPTHDRKSGCPAKTVEEV